MGFHRDDLDSFQGTPEELIEGYLRQLLGQRDSTATPGEETDFPPLDIFESTESITVEAELPDIDMDKLEVSITSGTLVIEGLKHEIHKQERVNFLCMERSFGTFRRIIPLMQSVDSSRIKAFYRMGILQVTIPKMTEKRGLRRIVPVTVD